MITGLSDKIILWLISARAFSDEYEFEHEDRCMTDTDTERDKT